MGMHSCNYCNYTSDRMYNLKVHVRNKHENNKNVTYSSGVPSSFQGSSAQPTTISAHPTQLGSGIRTNEPTSHCESGPSQVYNSPANTVSIEEYNKATDSAHGWKSAYDNLNN